MTPYSKRLRLPDIPMETDDPGLRIAALEDRCRRLERIVDLLGEMDVFPDIRLRVDEIAKAPFKMEPCQEPPLKVGSVVEIGQVLFVHDAPQLWLTPEGRDRHICMMIDETSRYATLLAARITPEKIEAFANHETDLRGFFVQSRCTIATVDRAQVVILSHAIHGTNLLDEFLPSEGLFLDAELLKPRDTGPTP